MRNISDFLGSSKPKLITEYTTGTGTHVPTADKARCYVRIVAGGAGGWSTISNSGGGAGAMIEGWLRIPLTGFAYAIGAAGAVSTTGSKTTFGPLVALPGKTPVSSTASGVGGIVNIGFGVVDADGLTLANVGLSGVAGGAGGKSGANGLRAGFPLVPADHPTINAGISTLMAAVADFANTVGLSSGGNSFFGSGGADGAAPLAGAYGAGGGASAAGLGGYIEIWDYGV